MNNNYMVLEGKSFTVDLMSNVGSTNYGWCLTSMPKEIILIGTDTIPVEPIMAGGKSIQRFYFGAKSSENTQVTLQFELLSMSELSKVGDTYTLEVQIVPCNSDDYVKYSENAEQAAIPYGYVYDNNPIPAEKYGYPCGTQDAMAAASLKYGYPCGTQDAMAASLKYGYPCGTQDAMAASLKYGYPCGTQDAMAASLKYGYPCGTQDAMAASLKYGYPCGTQDAMTASLKYGYPCGAQDAMTVPLKYGYPCAPQTAPDVYPLYVKYGYPCTVAYGVPNPTLDNGCPMPDYGYPVVAYGYPCRVAYGYPNGGWR